MDQLSVPSLPLEHNGKALPGVTASRVENRAVGQHGWRTKLLLAVGVLVVGAVCIGVTRSDDHASSSASSLDDAGSNQALGVVALGRLMPRGDMVYLAPPFGAGDARIARLLVEEGQTVDAGAVIAELDSLPLLRAAVAAAEANQAAMQSAMEKSRSNAASSRQEAAAELARAQAAASLAAAQADRQRSLFARHLVAKASLDEFESNEVRAARELDRATAHWQRQQGGDQQPDVALAITQLEVARQSLAQARAALAGGFVAAPFTGTLITLHARVGEKVGNLGIASFGDLRSMQAELEVYQTDIGRVAVGQPALLGSPALATPLRGTVERIGLEVERQSVLASDPAANTDARVVRVRVLIDATDRERAARLSGLEVTGHIGAMQR